MGSEMKRAGEVVSNHVEKGDCSPIQKRRSHGPGKLGTWDKKRIGQPLHAGEGRARIRKGKRKGRLAKLNGGGGWGGSRPPTGVEKSAKIGRRQSISGTAKKGPDMGGGGITNCRKAANS